MDKTGEFWFSKKAVRRHSELGDFDHDLMRRNVYTRNYCRLYLLGFIPWKIVEYTEWTRGNNPVSKFDDLEYLGRGKYHHSIQCPVVLPHVNCRCMKEWRA